MNRRDFLRSTAALLATPTALGQDQPTVTVTVGAPQALPPIPADFMGLGYEISSVARPHLLSPANTVYVQTVRTLSPHGVLRVGGNTADYAHYASVAPVVSSPYGTVVNDAVLQDLGGFLRATGWKLIWALNLGSGSETEAVAEARAVMHAAGERLLAFEIGNEPDIFPGEKHRPAGYSYDDWLAEYRRYKTALRSQFPNIRFAGPDAAAKTDWVTRFAADEGKDCVLLTHHYYREGQNPSSTIAKLLAVDPKLQHQLDQLRAASQSCGVPYRICEVNSFSGGGRPGVSDTTAAAVWALDYLWTLASNGCAGVNMETGVNQLGFISSYSPIGDDEQGHCVVKPEFYGLLAFALAQGKLLTAEMDRDRPEIRAYASLPSPGRLLVTLINKGDAAASIHVVAEGRSSDRASVIRLSGPSPNATTGVSLGGAMVSPQGSWKPGKPEALRLQRGGLSLSLPPVSAAIVEVSFAK